MVEQVGDRLGVVIVNYNSSLDIIRCIQSLCGTAVTDICIVDNNSATPEVNMLKSFLSEMGSCLDIAVDATFNGKNLGFGAAVNQGVQSLALAPSEVLWILNPDTVVMDTAVESLLCAIRLRPSAIYSPLIQWGASGEYWFAGGSIDLARGRSEHWHYPRSESVDFEVGFINGAAPLMLMSTWSLIGGFDHSLFLYWEDADLSLRASELGIPLVMCVSANIWHRVGGSGAPVGRSLAYHYYMARNRLWVCGQRSSKWRVLAGAGRVETIRLLYWAFREKDDPFGKGIASLRGLADGMRRE